MSEIGLDRPGTQHTLLTAEQIDAMPMYEWEVAQLGDAPPLEGDMEDLLETPLRPLWFRKCRGRFEDLVGAKTHVGDYPHPALACYLGSF